MRVIADHPSQPLNSTKNIDYKDLLNKNNLRQVSFSIFLNIRYNYYLFISCKF